MADVQYAEKPASGERAYALAKPRLQECVAALNAMKPQPAFVIQLGDFIDGGSAAQAEMTAMAAIYNTLDMPRYHVLGNHDLAGLRREQTLSILGMERAYYAFDREGWRFVTLDTEENTIQGGLGEDQLMWLEATLAEADAKKMAVIVFGHKPMIAPATGKSESEAREVVAVFERHACVKAYFCGHVHTSGHLRRNGIYYASFEAMVDRADKEAVWYKVRLTPEAIEVEGVGVPDQWTLEAIKDKR
jgi:3',5'-cyclic AMP phosphodiesterase CpdA